MSHYWKANLKIVSCLLLVWYLVSFGFDSFTPGFFCKLWQALAGPGRPWQALAGHGRPWQAPAGLGRSEPIRTCTLGPSLPFPALDRASCGYSSH